MWQDRSVMAVEYAYFSVHVQTIYTIVVPRYDVVSHVQYIGSFYYLENYQPQLDYPCN